MFANPPYPPPNPGGLPYIIMAVVVASHYYIRKAFKKY